MTDLYVSYGTYLISLVTILLMSIYIYFKYKYTYWTDKGVVCVPPIVPFGNMFQTIVLKKSAFEILSDAHKQFKKAGIKYGGLFMFGNPVFVPVDLELMRTILSRDFDSFTDRSSFSEDGDILSGNLFGAKGNKWRHIRRKLTPALTSGKMKMMLQTLHVCRKQLESSIRILARKSEPIDIRQIFERFTTDVICSIAFGIDSNCLQNPESEFFKYVKLVLTSSFSENIRNLCHITVPGLLKLLHIPVANSDFINFYMDIIKRNVQYREENNIERNDFLDLLIKLKNKKSISDDSVTKEDRNMEFGVTIDELACHSIAFFFGGYETTASTLTYCFYELAIHTEIQTKLRKEICEILEQHSNEITYEALMEMSYMDKVMKEVLRIHPVATFLNRKCVENYKIPDTDLVIEKGTDIFISILGIHSDAEYYPDPMKFDPERFNEENVTKRHPYTFMGFGEGPRMCIGKRFAIMEVKMVLASLLMNLKFTLNENTVLPLVIDPVIPFLAYKNTIWLNCEEINI